MGRSSVPFLLLLAVAGGAQGEEYVFSTSEGQKLRYQLAEHEVHTGKGLMSLRQGVKEFGRQKTVAAGAAPVFYDRQELPPSDKLPALETTARERRLTSARRIMTETLLVKVAASRATELAPTRPLKQEPSLIAGWLLVRYVSPFDALAAVDWMMQRGGWEFTPVFSRRHEKRQVLQRPVNDELYPQQWHLQPERFHLTLKNTWDTVTGRGVNIAVVDDGLDIRHEDLSGNAYPLESGYHYNFNEGPDEDPSPLNPGESHGTACAGLAAAVGFNNRGVVGVAPEARLMGLRLIAGEASDEATGLALAWQPRGVVTHVSSNSWGPADDGQAAGRMSALQAAGLELAATENRSGLGTVFVISAGNGRAEGDDSSYDGFSSSRYAIAVAAVNRNGVQSSYSENGMNVAISALGGEFTPPGVMWTTNNSGEEAYALKEEKFPTSEAPMHYTDAFNGTSSAAPQISGAAALMLERNPRLGNRDVKEILIRTANREGLRGSDEFQVNGAGIAFSHSFGAGLVNVAAAVERAATWRNLGQLVFAEVVSQTPGELPDGELVAQTFDFTGLPKIRVEHVELVVNVAHKNRGDVDFAIIAPSGMRSVAEARKPDEGADFANYKFTSVRHWGEESTGVWRVAIADLAKNRIGGEIGRVTLRIYGTAVQ